MPNLLKRLTLALMLVVSAALAVPVAQIVIPYTFTAGTIIDPDQMNTNFTTVSTNALNRTGGTLTGPLTTQTLVPSATNTYDVGSAGVIYRAGYFGTLSATGAASVGGVFLATGNVALNIATTGNKQVNIGGNPADNSAVFLNLVASNTQTNWSLRTNTTVAGALEFTPSTAAGGSTFTTPAMTLSTTGLRVLGTGDVFGNFAVNTSRFTVNAATGDSTVFGTLQVGTGTAQWKTAVSGADVYLTGYSGTQKFLKAVTGNNYVFSGGTSLGIVNAGETAVVAQFSNTGALSLGGFQLTDAVSVPTISSTCGTSPTIVGKAYAFKVTVGSGGTATNCGITFNTTFNNVPVAIVHTDSSVDVYVAGVTTTTLSIASTTGAALVPATQIYVLVRGY